MVPNSLWIKCLLWQIRPNIPPPDTMHTYVWPDAYVHVGLRIYMCRLMPPYVQPDAYVHILRFSKMPAWFSCGGKRIIPSLGRSYLLFPSSLHFNQNIQIINLLKMTGHPLILVSAVLFNSLQNLPSAFVSQEEVLRMKGGWKGGDEVSPHYQSPHKQGVSTANERRKEEVDFR